MNARQENRSGHGFPGMFSLAPASTSAPIHSIPRHRLDIPSPASNTVVGRQDSLLNPGHILTPATYWHP